MTRKRVDPPWLVWWFFFAFVPALIAYLVLWALALIRYA